jgi:hypothetical protein
MTYFAAKFNGKRSLLRPRIRWEDIETEVESCENMKWHRIGVYCSAVAGKINISTTAGSFINTDYED